MDVQKRKCYDDESDYEHKRINNIIDDINTELVKINVKVESEQQVEKINVEKRKHYLSESDDSDDSDDKFDDKFEHKRINNIIDDMNTELVKIVESEQQVEKINVEKRKHYLSESDDSDDSDDDSDELIDQFENKRFDQNKKIVTENTSDGMIRYEVVDGKKNGAWIKYDKFGNINERCNYKNDLRHGNEYIYRYCDKPFTKPIVLSRVSYKDGIKHGSQKIFAYDGITNYIIIDNEYINGERVKAVYYKKNGDKSCIQNFKNGEYHGEMIFYENKNITEIYNYKNGKFHGEMIFYKNKNITEIRYYKDDNLEKCIKFDDKKI
jgi:antitoxin component YwqK of YwqJK toxin-antitoxin module